MEDGLPGTLEGVDGAADELLATWREDLDPDVVGDYARCADEALCEVEVGLGGRREGDFDFLVAELDEHLEVGPFLLAILRWSALLAGGREKVHGASDQGGLTMGSTRLWLPSLRSVDSHRGGLSIVLLGHDRSGRFSGWKALYFFHGSLSIGMMSGHSQST